MGRGDDRRRVRRRYGIDDEVALEIVVAVVVVIIVDAVAAQVGDGAADQQPVGAVRQRRSTAQDASVEVELRLA